MPNTAKSRPEERAAVEAIVEAAYSIYHERIGKPPGPMLHDYARLIEVRRRAGRRTVFPTWFPSWASGICRSPAR